MPAANLATYIELADNTASRLTYSHQEWTGFLKTAARLYKYPYHEQIMIYAQRPDATACADYDVWNNRMRRYVRRGSKGIALVDNTGNQPKLRYVFDVADTGARENSVEFQPWTLTEDNAQAASLALERGYDVPAREGIARQLHAVAQQLSQLYCIDHRREISDIVDGSFLEGYDEFMLMKCRYMDEITDGRGVVFATGTPVSNSMTELYTMQRYLQHDALQRNNLSHFDCWASTFGETVTSIELAPEGTGYRARTRFAKFFNLPELMTLFKETADIKTADVLNLPTPEAIYHNVVAQPTVTLFLQLAMVAFFLKGGKPYRHDPHHPHAPNQRQNRRPMLIRSHGLR